MSNDRLPSEALVRAANLQKQLARFPTVGLAHVPTPLEPMKRLTEHLGGPSLWVKREDCTGLGLGGNKLRKLDSVLRDALDAGAALDRARSEAPWRRVSEVR
jgi:hypothetical protein